MTVKNKRKGYGQDAQSASNFDMATVLYRTPLIIKLQRPQNNVAVSRNQCCLAATLMSHAQKLNIAIVAFYNYFLTVRLLQINEVQ